MDLVDGLVIGSCSADLLTTELALADGGFREFSPILQNQSVRISLKVLAPAAVIGIGRILDKRGHKGWSRALKWTAIVVYSGAAVNNVIQMNRKGK